MEDSYVKSNNRQKQNSSLNKTTNNSFKKYYNDDIIKRNIENAFNYSHYNLLDLLTKS